MEKRKAKRETNTQRLSHTIPFDYVSRLPFHECMARLQSIEAKSLIRRYQVEAYVVDDTYGRYPTCAFRICPHRSSSEVVGFLQAEETTTRVKGTVGLRRQEYVGSSVLVAAGFIVLTMALCQRFEAWSTPLFCFVLVGTLTLSVAWWFQFGERYRLLRFLQRTLEIRQG